MENIDSKAIGVQKSKCTVCTKDRPCETCLMQTLLVALENIDKLTGKMEKLEHVIGLQSRRIGNLEISSNSEDSDKDEKVSNKPSTREKQANHLQAVTVKSKTSRVEQEKERQFKVLRDKLGSIDRDMSESSDSVNDTPNLKSRGEKNRSKRKLYGKHQVLCGQKKMGAIVSEDSDTSTCSSEVSSEIRHRHRRQVRSGAKVKKRPVVKTELWPHTIANEDDGDEVTSESIGCAKFLSCFTYIMMNCGRVESAGRISLLNAVTTIMEYSFWTEARTFHNLVMVKLEQDRISWYTDFTELANQFLDKKVRQSLRYRELKTDNSYYKSNSYKSGDKGFGKFNRHNFGSPISNYNSNRNKALYSVVCWQWNNGFCPYGDRCKK